MKKVTALLLVLVMLLSLAACGAKQDTPAAPEAAEAPVAADAPAAESEREHVTLKFYNRAAEQADQQAVFDKLNEYFEEKFNTTVEWQLLGGTYADKINVIINSGEEYDACFTSNWLNDYVTNVSRGAFLDLTDLLKDYPDLVNSMPASFWTAATVDGGIYAVPNQQIAARTPPLSVPTEYMEAFGWTVEDLDKIQSISEMTDYAQFCLDNYGAHFAGVLDDNIAEYCGYQLLGSQANALAVKVGDPEAKVVNLYETPEFAAMCNEMAELHAKGLTDAQLLLDSQYLRAEIISGRVSGYLTGTYKPGGDVYASNNYGVPISMAPLGTPLLSTGGIIATMWGISSSSEHPDRVLEILQALATDPYVMQMVSFGIEGTHYEMEDGFMVLTPDSGYNHGNDWAFGNVFLCAPTKGMPADVWEQTAKINATATESALLGFSYSVSNVEAEITNITNTYNTYKAVITGELPVEATLKEFNEKLKVAGIDTAIADAQAQIDAFLGK